MITQENIRRLDRRIAQLALRDYLTANKPLSQRSKAEQRKFLRGESIHRPYTLGVDTMEVLDLYRIAIRPPVTCEDEERIKAYLLRVKLQDSCE